MIHPSDIWDRVDEVTRRESDRALASIPTLCEVVEEDGIPYQIRRLVGLHPKRKARREQMRTGRNPFLPPEPELLVGDVTSTHVGVLNKFNVFGGHLLLVTREFVSQEAPLDRADFDALSVALEGFDGLGFFNGGKTAGASQPHKHLQIAPLPLEPETEGLSTPMDAAINRGSIPFGHALRLLPGTGINRDDGKGLFEIFRELSSELGLVASPRPFNLLLTRRWMMVVSRIRERIEEVPINALGFAGSLLVRDEAMAQRVKEVGPGSILRGVVG